MKKSRILLISETCSIPSYKKTNNVDLEYKLNLELENIENEIRKI